MVQYYYDKYTSLEEKVWRLGSWAYTGDNTGPFMDSKSFTFDPKTNTVQLQRKWGVNDTVSVGSSNYYLSGTTLVRQDSKEERLNSSTIDYSGYRIDLPSNSYNTLYSKGSLVQSNIAAEDGTYPANGKHTDGYWYVKGAVVGPLPPGTVINQPYSTAGNGGRKLVRLSNGWLVAVTISNTSGVFLHVSKDNGINWSALTRIEQAVSDVAIASTGTQVYVLASYINNTSLRFYRFDAITVSDVNMVTNGVNIDNNQQRFGNVSLAVNPLNGHLHATWVSKNATYPNSFNIRYAQSTDGGITWSAAEQVTNMNQSNFDIVQPSIAILNSQPYIAVTSGWGHASSDSVALISKTIGTAGSIGTTGGWKGLKIFATGYVMYGEEISLIVDKEGALHATFTSRPNTGATTKNIHYAKSINGGLNWTVTELTNNVDNNYYQPTLTIDKNKKLVVVWYAHTGTQIQMREFKNNTWQSIVVVDTGSYSSTLYDPFLAGILEDVPPMIYQKSSTVVYKGSYSLNNAPAITLTLPTNNQTLYENDTINISGEAYDADKDQSVTAYYQINSEQRKVLATNLSQTQIALSKQLTFKGGKLYDGDTALSGTLADGVAHTLKVWAEDSEKASSTIVERTFYVVPNRAPLLSVDAVVPSGVVDADKFKISGTASDQDANSTVEVTRRINAGNAVEIYSGASGAWEFEVILSQLVVGQNTIVIEVVDNYGAKTSKTVTLNKKVVKTPILQSVARYKIEPPKGSAKGVLLFIQHDEELDMRVELSMTLNGEQEQYKTLTPVNTAPIQQGVVEDTFEYEGLEAKQNIILKITPSRTDLSFNHKIHLISGAVD